MSCRCSSCGYIHEVNDTDRPVLDAEPERVVAAVIPAVVQQARCPLCGELFEDVGEYDAHRARNCEPAPEPEETEIPVEGDPLVTDPNPAEPAGPQE